MHESPEHVIDLSNPVSPDQPGWPTLMTPEIDQIQWAPRDGVTMEKVEMVSHTGTHIDAPLHFIEEGKTLDDYPLEKFMGEGIVLDLTPVEPEAPITVEMLQTFEDQIQPDDVVMLYTGWGKYHGRNERYLFEFPYLTDDSARYLAELDIKAVGTEGLSVAGWDGDLPNHGPATELHPSETHVPLFENDVLAVEELRHLDKVLDGEETRRAYFSFVPINFQNTSGSPVRAYASL
ncbi:cyclase family protein [Haladaptatus sp. CMAA 1911]|uniref:cyclase family protein n=1 Tax=unclassified Haladaptatus TaxID=2622732 RepID=UPI0037548121